MPVFSNELLKPAPADPIMAANARYQAAMAENPETVTTAVGVVYDDAGDIFMPAPVSDALKMVPVVACGYQNPRGHEGYLQTVAGRLGVETSQVVSVQTAGGTGALSLAARVLPRLFTRPDTQASSSTEPQPPTIHIDTGWPNYAAVYDGWIQKSVPRTTGYDHAAFLKSVQSLPPGTVVLLQASGYNGDGLDRTPAQWDELTELIAEKGLVPLVDSAYSELIENRNPRYTFGPFRGLVERGVPIFMAHSDSKMLGMYGKRLGALVGVNIPDELRESVQAAMNAAVRSTVSNLPSEFAEAVYQAYQTNSEQIRVEQLAMAALLNARRETFADILGAPYSAAIRAGRGLFTTILPQGFTPEQHQRIERQGIIALPNSRINFGGITTQNTPQVAEVIRSALYTQAP